MMDRAGPGLAPPAPAPSFSDLVLVLCLSHQARVEPANQQTWPVQSYNCGDNKTNLLIYLQDNLTEQTIT